MVGNCLENRDASEGATGFDSSAIRHFMIEDQEDWTKLVCEGCGAISGKDHAGWTRTGLAVKTDAPDDIASWCPACQANPEVITRGGRDKDHITFEMPLVDVLGTRRK
jgi:hypothetical protein